VKPKILADLMFINTKIFFPLKVGKDMRGVVNEHYYEIIFLARPAVTRV